MTTTDATARFAKRIEFDSRWRKNSLLKLYLALVACLTSSVLPGGTWTQLVNPAPKSVSLMLLLSDGTVMTVNGGREWNRLTPDIHGSYVNGTWSTLASMNDTRLYFSSDVLPDGRVFVAGGEYGTGTSSAEMYDPVLDNWTFCPGSGQLFSDSVSVVIANGNVLIAPTWPSHYGTTVIYSPYANSWTTGIPLVRGFDQDEASWVKLPDNSILTDDPYGLSATNSERYIPSLNAWVNDSSVPVSLYDRGDELGAAFLLPTGKAFFIGAGGHTALYTPTGTTNRGTWVAGPNIPKSQVAPDAPAAMLVTGHILCAVDHTNGPPTSFYEYDPFTNKFTQVSGPSSITNTLQTYYTYMLDLPDGTVLFTYGSQTLFVYQPAGAPLATGQPGILSISTNYYRCYHLRGTLLNGISQGAAYGDDAQMDSNYPLVRLTNSAGNVYYARTYNWSSTGVMTGTNVVSTDFMLPANLPAGTYSLVAVANGNSSAPVSFTFAPDALKLSSPKGFAASGPANGPFAPASQAYVLMNTGTSALNWSLANMPPWLTVTPGSGTISPNGGTGTFTVAINSAASLLSTGLYGATIWLTNTSSGVAQSLSFSLQVNPLANNGGFESGSSGYWSLSGGTGSTTVGNTGDFSGDTAYIHSGLYAAMLGKNSSMGYLSQTIPTVSGKLYQLSFWLDSPSASATNEFTISWNGRTIYDRASFPYSGFSNFVFSIPATASSGTLTFGFQNTSDYFGLDDITLLPIASGAATALPDRPIEVSGFNLGVVVPHTATGGNTAPYAQPFNPQAGNTFYEAGLGEIAPSSDGSGSEGLPASGSFTSILDGTTTFQFGPYTNNNVLYLTPNSRSGTLSPLSPTAYTSLDILAASVNGGGSGSFVIYFSDGSTSNPLFFNAPDWWSYSPGAALTGVGIIVTGNYGAFYTQDPTNLPNLYQTSFNLAALGLDTRPIVSLKFTMPNGPGTSTNTETGVFALSGIPVLPYFQSHIKTGNAFQFTWSAVPNETYQIQYCTNLMQGAWINLGDVVTATTALMTNSYAINTDSFRFYRIVLNP